MSHLNLPTNKLRFYLHIKTVQLHKSYFLFSKSCYLICVQLPDTISDQISSFSKHFVFNII